MIRRRTLDVPKIKSLLAAASHEIEFTKTIKISSDSASTIARNVYESFRMLGEALMLCRGKEAQGKDAHSVTMQELCSLDVHTERPIQILDNLRLLRHKINYDGYLASEAEAKDAVAISNIFFTPILKKIEEESKI